MLITRLYLRNFRIYEDELNLEMPPGLVGIFGPNGAGKSTLLEAILWTLWGKARTTKEQIRSAGVGSECVTEVEFEHEGHLYLMRRTIKGINSAVTVEAHCDGALMSTGTRDVERYVQSVIGMDDAAFRASVFTEQKQLAAFSSQSPGERRRLVLQLLGITPLDEARDLARKEARQTAGDHARLRQMLADPTAVQTDLADAEARAAAAEKASADEGRAAAAAAQRAEAARQAFEFLDRKRQQHDTLVIEGRAARQELDTFKGQVKEQQAELTELAAQAARVPDLETAAGDLEASEQVHQLLARALQAVSAVEKAAVPAEPAVVDEEAVTQAGAEAAQAREALAGLDAVLKVVASDLDRARNAASNSESLSGEADCPVCGQALGDAFEKVQAHRLEEVTAAEARAAHLRAQHQAAQAECKRAEATATKLVKAAEEARTRRQAWEQARDQQRRAHEAAQAAWVAASDAASAGAAGAAGAAGGAVAAGGEGTYPAAKELAATVEHRQAEIQAKRAAQADLARLRGRLERRPALEQSIVIADAKAKEADGRVVALRDQVKALGFDKDALAAAARAFDEATTAGGTATEAARAAELSAARDRERAKAAAEKLAETQRQHDQIAELESAARHLARTGDLLNSFRNTVIAEVGPNLARQAADLFGELTDHEYEDLAVDPDTYQLQIRDGGRLFGLDRFSGSEIDLANLALRVAISEHIHLQSGGSVGLLVLDEVFGPLDEDRKARMLLALERLRGRFRQVLVVTHDNEIKEQLPLAIQVERLPGRRATARLL